MKKAALFCCLWSACAFAAPITFNSVILTKVLSPGSWRVLANRDLREWCSGYSHGLQFGSFQAAKDYEALADGLYTCDGDFASIPGQPLVQAFRLANCHQEDPDALKKTCPTTP